MDPIKQSALYAIVHEMRRIAMDEDATEILNLCNAAEAILAGLPIQADEAPSSHHELDHGLGVPHEPGQFHFVPGKSGKPGEGAPF